MPEFPGQRRPFAKGHRLTVTHGANSPGVRDAVADRIEAEVLALPGREYLSEPQWRPVVRRYAWAQAMAEMIGDWTERLPMFSDEWVSAANEWLRHSSRAENLASKLGLTPLGAALLGLPVLADGADAPAAEGTG